ncbi:PEGA domain-containing protein [Desulfurobacterium sp.]
MKPKVIISALCLSATLFSCASSQTAPPNTTNIKDADIQAVQSKSEKAFQELEEEFKPSPPPANSTQEQKTEETETVEKELEKAPAYSTGKIVIKECAYGKNQKDARITALKRVSQDILSNVNALEMTKKQLKNGKITREYLSNTVIGTRTILKEIQFKDLGRTPEGYKVCAILTENGLSKTISFIKASLQRNLTELPPEELKTLKSKAFILISLAETAQDKKSINFGIEKIKEIDRLLNYGRLNVNVVPPYATVIIQNRKYKVGKTVLLEPQKEYFVTIKAPGYRSIRKRVYLGRGEIKNISIELPKLVKGNITVSIKANNPFVKRLAEKSMINSGFTIKDDAANVLKISIRDFTSSVKGYTKHQLEITATLYANGKPIISKTGKMKPFFTTKETENSVLKPKVEKLTRAVLNSLLNNINTEQLGGGKE